MVHGAQAFGWGLYFAGDKDVARFYRERLTQLKGNSVDDVKYEGRTALEWYAYWKERAARGGKDAQKYYDRMSMLEDYDVGKDPADIISEAKEMDMSSDAIEWFDKTIAQSKERPGALYKVDIPDESDGNYLMWDSAVPAEQAEKVFKAFTERGNKLPFNVTINGRSFAGMGYGDMIDEFDEAGAAVLTRIRTKVYYGDSLSDAINDTRSRYERDVALAGDIGGRSKEEAAMLSEQAEAARDRLAWLEANMDSLSVSSYSPEEFVEMWGERGRIFYEKLSDMLGSDKDASMLLRDAGFDGIKYLDGSSRRRGEGNYNYVIFDDQDVKVMETFYQPMNPDVDPDSFVHVVDLSGSYDGTSYSKVQELKNKIRGMVPLAITTADNKMLVEVLNRNTEHLAHSSAPLDISLNIPALRKATFDSLSDVIANAVLIESIKNEKITKIDPSWTKSKRRSINRKNTISFYHRLYVPITVDGKDYKTIRLVAEERADGNISVNPKTVELYDVIPEDKSARLSTAPANDSSKLIDLPGISRITIREMLSNVNDFYGDLYLQNSRGSITLPVYDGAPVRITLGKDADKSTFTHELAHLYLWHLKRLAAFDAVQNKASWAFWNYPAARWNNDLKVVSGWWDEQAEDIARQAAAYVAEDNKGTLSAAGFRQWLESGMETESEAGKAYSRSAQEYFARGFERYLAEGKAPSKELLSVFRRFKKWLCEIYRSLTELDVELSDKIRGVYDRMLAAEEAVERLRASRELDDVLSAMLPEGDEESMGEPYDFGDDPYEDAKERVLSGLLDKLTPERRKAMADYAEEIRPEITRAVAHDPGYRAIAMLEENPDLRLSADAVLDEFGENVVSAMPEGTLAENPGEGMTDLTVAARSLRFKSARDMINAMAGRRGTSEEIDARVRRVQGTWGCIIR